MIWGLMPWGLIAGGGDGVVLVDTPMTPDTDPVEAAFPDAAVAQRAHQVVGEAVCALVDRGYSLPAARALVTRGFTAPTDEMET